MYKSAVCSHNRAKAILNFHVRAYLFMSYVPILTKYYYRDFDSLKNEKTLGQIAKKLNDDLIKFLTPF